METKTAEKDIIYHHTTSQFGFMDRIRILFGKKVHIHSTLNTDQEKVDILSSSAMTVVEKIIPRRTQWMSHGMGEISREV